MSSCQHTLVSATNHEMRRSSYPLSRTQIVGRLTDRGHTTLEFCPDGGGASASHAMMQAGLRELRLRLRRAGALIGTHRICSSDRRPAFGVK